MAEPSAEGAKVSSEARDLTGEKSVMEEQWSLYIIECRTGDLYVGIAVDVDKRVGLHNKGRACRYTKFRGPVQLMYQEICGSYNEARKREKEVKRFSREKKLSLSLVQINRFDSSP